MLIEKRLRALFASVAPILLLSVASTAHAVNLDPTADAHVRSGVHQNSNYGSVATLEIKKSASATDDFNREIYLKFDLSSVTSIRSGKLRLYGSATSPEIVTAN